MSKREVRMFKTYQAERAIVQAKQAHYNLILVAVGALLSFLSSL